MKEVMHLLTINHTQEAAGLNWEQLRENSQPWQAFEALRLSWAAFESFILETLDPEAGFTWEDIQEEETVWQAFQDFDLTWKAFEALIPGGNWEDQTQTSVRQGESVLFQLNAKNIRAEKPVVFMVKYDPEILTWQEYFPQSRYGLVVQDGLPLPEILSHEDGTIKLQLTKDVTGKWSGVTAALLFTAKQEADTQLTLDNA